MSLHNTTSTNESQETFVPTWLYIKQHNKTGLKYLGKTVKDPLNYYGSGLHWIRHLKCHGKDVSTIWCQLYTDKETLVSTALSLSELHNIVESKEWANLKPENGLDGNVTGSKHSAKTIEKLKNRIFLPIRSERISNAVAARGSHNGRNNPNYGNKRTAESIALQKRNQPSSAGAKNGRAISWVITSPTGEKYSIFGEMKQFCRDHNLSASGMQVIADTGIPSTKGKNVGWMIQRQIAASEHTNLINSESAT